MKLVKEHIIFEKFIADSDPIRDMGIGFDVKLVKKYDLTNRYAAVSNKELTKLKSFFNGDKTDIFFLGSSNHHIPNKTLFNIIKKLTKDKHTILVEIKEYKDVTYGKTTMTMYKTPVGKLCITTSYQEKTPDRKFSWFLGDRDMIAHFYFNHKKILEKA